MDRSPRATPRRQSRLITPLRTLCTCAVVLIRMTVAAPRIDDPPTLPIALEVDVDSGALDATGVFDLTFHFTPAAPLSRNLALRLRVVHGVMPLFEREIAVDPPARRWKVESEVVMRTPVTFPVVPGLSGGRDLDLLFGFVDLDTRETLIPADRIPFSSEWVLVGSLDSPEFQPVDDGRADAMIERARVFRQAKQAAQAWDILELGVRLTDDDILKYRLRDELTALGHFPPRDLSHDERRIVAERIADERRRYLRLAAGRFFDRKQFHAAILLLEEVGGELAEQADAAVIGAVNDAERTAKDIEGARDALIDFVPPEDQSKVDALLAAKSETAALDAARKWLKAGRLGAARRVLHELRRSIDGAISSQAFELLPDVERRLLETIPPEQAAAAQAEIDHPAFARTTVVPSHRFLFIGPETLVRNIPEESRLHFDLAYVFLTDLFGRVPNPAGDRVTVYFKELWDFGGGVGGGKIIDIGNADPNAKGVQVDTGLLYHELTHCIDDTEPVFAGFREGLANVGAAYAFEALAQAGAADHSFADNLARFRADYLERDLEYWRIPNYGPSAGFFLSFVDKYAKRSGRGGGHDWAPLRRFFREYRTAPVRDGREPFIARSLAWYLMRAFGPGAFDDLVAYRFPLIPADREILGRELDAFQGAGLSDFDDDHTQYPNSPLPRDLKAQRLLDLAKRQQSAEARAFGQEQLGLIYDWKVIGPFSRKGTDVAGGVFPPEYEIDFARQYEVPNNLALWRDPTDHVPVTLEDTGWVRLEFPYQDHTASYGLTHVTVAAAQPAMIYARTDDDATLFVNDERVFAFDDRGRNASTRITWRGPDRNVPDAMRMPIALRAGRNKILLRVRNHSGPAGFSLAVANRDGSPIPGMIADAGPPETPRTTRPAEWRRVFAQDFSRKRSTSSLDVTVGGFRVDARGLTGTTTDKGVGFRKYTVRPGFPKDSPSNLAWVDAKATKDLRDAARVCIVADGGCPKLLVTIQGDGGTDGLSGWNLILLPHGGGRVEARLERYDRLVYHCGPTEIGAAAAETAIVFALLDGRISVIVGDTPLFNGVPVRGIPARQRVGFATWGTDARLRSIEVEAPK